MSLDLSKLQNVVTKANGEIQARCPACAAAGLDTKGEHLKVFVDGKYSCAANQGDKQHRKEIYRLAGKPDVPTVPEKVSVKTFKVPDSTVIMELARFDRFARKARQVANGAGPITR